MFDLLAVRPSIVTGAAKSIEPGAVSNSQFCSVMLDFNCSAETTYLRFSQSRTPFTGNASIALCRTLVWSTFGDALNPAVESGTGVTKNSSPDKKWNAAIAAYGRKSAHRSKVIR